MFCLPKPNYWGGGGGILVLQTCYKWGLRLEVDPYMFSSICCIFAEAVIFGRIRRYDNSSRQEENVISILIIVSSCGHICCRHYRRIQKRRVGHLVVLPWCSNRHHHPPLVSLPSSFTSPSRGWSG